MIIVLLIIQVLSGLLLITGVLLHQPSGEGLGGMTGQSRVFNHRSGLEKGLNKFTATVAGVFMISSILLAVIQ
ncbi:preprotein translocase subunit SecG [Candidatus Marinamargulisbacteria bacterium]|jgi:protein translocase SecG subunit|nr:preprotein translocase subunit SecG [Candidatus Marinamargulisbacteria bacterium]